jgi:hypothetical protein
VTRLKHRHYRCDDISREVESVVEHIAELLNRCFAELDCSILREILGHRKMQIESEDWLFDFVISSIERDISKVEVLEFIYFEMLNSSSMKQFAQLDFEYISGLNSQIWQRICNRLVIELWRDSKEYRSRRSELSDRYTTESREFNPPEPFNGLISYLTSKHGGNIHDRGIVNVTQSSESSTSGHILRRIVLI